MEFFTSDVPFRAENLPMNVRNLRPARTRRYDVCMNRSSMSAHAGQGYMAQARTRRKGDRSLPGFARLGVLLLAMAGVLMACGGGGAGASWSSPGPASSGTPPPPPPPPSGDTIPPTAPTALQAAPNGPFAVDLSWQPATDNVLVTGYRVERCQGAGCGNFVQVAAVGGTSLVDTGLSAATDYRYQVRAVDAAPNLGPYSSVAAATTNPLPPPPPGNLPAWVSALAIGEWYPIPNTALSSIAPSPTPPGNTGPSSKVGAWTSFVVDTRNSMVYSVANGGHNDYAGNEVDRLELENDPPRWVARLAPSTQISANQPYYADGRPNSRHTYYGVTLNEFNDRIMLVSGAQYSNGFLLGTTDSYNITANAYSAAGTHSNVPSAVQLHGFAVTGNPLTGDIFAFGDFAFAKWTRSTNSWSSTGQSQGNPYGQGSMSAMDTTRGRILIIGGRGASPDRHTYTLSSNAFAQITLSGPNAGNVSGADSAAMVYVPALDSYLVRLAGAGGAVYMINASSFSATTFPTTNGGSIPSTQNGPFNKFLFVPRLGGCVYVPSYTGNAWFLRVQ